MERRHAPKRAKMRGDVDGQVAWAGPLGPARLAQFSARAIALCPSTQSRWTILRTSIALWWASGSLRSASARLYIAWRHARTRYEQTKHWASRSARPSLKVRQGVIVSSSISDIVVEKKRAELYHRLLIHLVWRGLTHGGTGAFGESEWVPFRRSLKW